jgi:hypothetical protein
VARAFAPLTLGCPAKHELLSDDERARLAAISSIVRFKKEIYSAGETAQAIFNVISWLRRTAVLAIRLRGFPKRMTIAAADSGLA